MGHVVMWIAGAVVLLMGWACTGVGGEERKDAYAWTGFAFIALGALVWRFA